MNKNIVKILQLSVISVFLLLHTACVEDGIKQSTASSNSHSLNNNSAISIEAPKIKSPSEFSPHARQVAKAVQESKARLASEATDICPKLIEFSVDNHIVVRQNEKMERQKCKYYLYPDVDTILNVQIDNPSLKAAIVQPEYFNFANGTYRVSNNGKHVIEISYKEHHGDRSAESYNIRVSHL